MRRAPLLLTSLIAMLSASGLEVRFASAQSADAGLAHQAPLTDSLSGAAKEAYDAAVVLLNNKDCGRAIAKYRQAYDLSQDPRLLFDIAVCERDLRAYAQMQELLLRYEREAGGEMSAGQRADVEAALAAIHNLVGTVHLTVSEEGAEVTVDSELVGTTPLATPLVVDLGQHALSVKKAGFDPAARAIEIPGGDETTIEITLVPRTRPALLRVAADPGATIVIDKREIVHGSFDGALAPGAHDVQVTEVGKRDYQTRIVLGDGEARSLQVTLENEHRTTLWPWIAGGVAVVVGASVGGYFLLRQQDTRGAGPQGQIPSVQIPGTN